MNAKRVVLSDITSDTVLMQQYLNGQFMYSVKLTDTYNFQRGNVEIARSHCGERCTFYLINIMTGSIVDFQAELIGDKYVSKSKFTVLTRAETMAKVNSQVQSRLADLNEQKERYQRMLQQINNFLYRDLA
jgi:hypothetical protein